MQYIYVSIKDQPPRETASTGEAEGLLELRLVNPANEEQLFALSFPALSENEGNYTNIFPYQDQAIAVSITFGQSEEPQEKPIRNTFSAEEDQEKTQESAEMEPDPPSTTGESLPAAEIEESPQAAIVVETSEPIASEKKDPEEVTVAPESRIEEETIEKRETLPAEEEIKTEATAISPLAPEEREVEENHEDSDSLKEENSAGLDNAEKIRVERPPLSEASTAVEAESDANRTEIEPGEDSDYIDKQMHSYQHLAWELVMFDPEGSVFSLEEAAETIGTFAERGRMDAIFLNFQFRNSLDQLIEEWRESQGEIKEVLTKAIENLSKAFLDIIAFNGPKVWGPYTRHTLNDTRQQLRNIPGLDFRDISTQCLEAWTSIKDAAFLKKMKSSLGL